MDIWIEGYGWFCVSLSGVIMWIYGLRGMGGFVSVDDYVGIIA